MKRHSSVASSRNNASPLTQRLVMAALLLGIAGCGQKGPLRLPQAPASAGAGSAASAPG